MTDNLRAALADCCTRMERARGILQEDTGGNWAMLDTEKARAALATPAEVRAVAPDLDSLWGTMPNGSLLLEPKAVAMKFARMALAAADARFDAALKAAGQAAACIDDGKRHYIIQTARNAWNLAAPRIAEPAADSEGLRQAVRALKQVLFQGGSGVALPADSWIERAFLAAYSAAQPPAQAEPISASPAGERDAIDRLIERHVGSHELADDEYHSMVTFARVVIQHERERCAQLCELWNATPAGRLADEIRKG